MSRVAVLHLESLSAIGPLPFACWTTQALAQCGSIEGLFGSMMTISDRVLGGRSESWLSVHLRRPEILIDLELFGYSAGAFFGARRAAIAVGSSRPKTAQCSSTRLATCLEDATYFLMFLETQEVCRSAAASLAMSTFRSLLRRLGGPAGESRRQHFQAGSILSPGRQGRHPSRLALARTNSSLRDHRQFADQG